VSFEGFNGLVQLFGGRWLLMGQTALNEHRHAFADETVHLGLSARRGTDFVQHQTAPFGEIGNGVEQRSV
jgi:hypothetical protein